VSFAWDILFGKFLEANARAILLLITQVEPGRPPQASKIFENFGNLDTGAFTQ
jgi:hypothetical protein